MSAILRARCVYEIVDAEGRVYEAGTLNGPAESTLTNGEVMQRRVTCAAAATTVLWTSGDTVQDFQAMILELLDGPSVMVMFKIHTGASPNGQSLPLNSCGPLAIFGDDAWRAWTAVPSDGTLALITEIAIVNLDADEAAVVSLTLGR